MKEDNLNIKCELISDDEFIGSSEFDFDKIIFDLNSQIDLLSSQADSLDYIVAIASGTVCSILDILWVGVVGLGVVCLLWLIVTHILVLWCLVVATISIACIIPTL